MCDTDYVQVAKNLYPQDKDSDYAYFCGFCGYQPIINYLGTVAIQVDDDDYQGDTRVLYTDPVKGVGYLQFGWGSCSGCDAMQACESYEDVAALIQRLEKSVRWDTKEGMLKYFNEHDWEGDYSWHYTEQQQFVRLVKNYLGGA